MLRIIARWIIFTLVLGGLVLALSDGWHDTWMWVYVCTISLCVLYAAMSVTRDLARERFRPPSRGEDARALVFIRLLGFGHLIVGALDTGRWHIMPVVPPALRGTALVAMAIAYLFVFRAMRENRFFSAVVRIQSDRGHQVVDTGPYSVVRHPGYAGMAVGIPASGLALGSWLGFAIAIGYAALILRRAAFEDRFLQRELAGYAEYTQRVPSRVIPGLW